MPRDLESDTAPDDIRDDPDSPGARTAHHPDRAELWRMVMPEHVCPFGQKSRWVLRREGYAVDDRLLQTREEQEALKDRFGVETSPQAWIDGERIGGYEALRAHFGWDPAQPEGKTYRPVVAIFGMAAAMALAITLAAVVILPAGGPLVVTAERFGAALMCLLALQKLQDVEGFTNGFLNYDLLSQRYVPYAYAYPWLEGAAGVLMLAGGILGTIAAPVSLFIGIVGGAGVVKAAFIDRRDLTCACVGGGSNVPLGLLSFSENVIMTAMGAWMLAKPFVY